jgi:hypothetical protein
MRIALAALCSLVALATPSAAGAQTRATVTVVASIDLQALIGRSAAELTAAVLGQTTETRHGFEAIHNGAHVGLIDVAQLGQARCRNNNGISGATMLVRDGVVVGSVPPTSTLLRRGLPPPQRSHDVVDGRIQRVSPDATPEDTPAPLPLASGIADVDALVRSANSTPGSFNVVCREYSGGSTEGAVQSATLAPLILVRPFENQSREHARVHGAALYDAIALGAPLPADLESQAREARVRVRVHGGGANYQVLTIDAGGRASRGVAQPRSVGYVGVRDGSVEWKALDPTGNALSDILCRAADGRRGRVRPGCSTTGFYMP